MKKLSLLIALCMLLSLVTTLIPFSVAADEAVVFISDTGVDSNDGKTAETAVATFDAAYALLPDEGGTIVLCGVVTLSNSLMDDYYYAPEKSGTITLTCKYNGIDYRETGAGLGYDTWYFMNAPHVIDNFQFLVQRNTQLFCCNGYELLIGDDVICTQDGATNYIGITAGRNDDTVQEEHLGGKLTINSGDWQMIRGGTRNTKSLDCVNKGGPDVTINGGTFHAQVYVGGDGLIQGDAKLTINGGTFLHNIVPINAGDVDGNLTVTINGGDFRSIPNNTINMFIKDAGILGGKATFILNGGTFKEGFTITCNDENGNEAFGGSLLDMSNWTTVPVGLVHNGWDTAIESPHEPVTAEPPTEPVTEAIVVPADFNLFADLNPDAIVEDLSVILADQVPVDITGSVGIVGIAAQTPGGADGAKVSLEEENGEKFVRLTNTETSGTYNQIYFNLDPALFYNAEQLYVSVTLRTNKEFKTNDGNRRAIVARFADPIMDNVIVTGSNLDVRDFSEWRTITFTCKPSSAPKVLRFINFANHGDYMDIKDLQIFAASEPITIEITEPVTEPPTEPVTQPATEPKTEPATEPKTEPATNKPDTNKPAPVAPVDDGVNVGLIIGIVAAVVVVAVVAIIIIKKAKKK